MASREILMAFKSTLDKLVGDLAAELSAAAPSANPVKFFDMDDHEGLRQVQASAEHALVYQYMTLAEDPSHPLYQAEFVVGAKTSQDSGNYAMTDLLTDIQGRFTKGAYFDLMDYSGETMPTELLGSMMLISCTPSPQMFENSAGIRVFQISAKVMANG